MSKKRIFIREVENPCADCENKGCNVCNCGEIWKAAIPRAEAVERMGKAMCIATGFDVCEECKKRKDVNCLTRLRRNGHIMRAEAALDALLGGKNG